MSFFRNDPQSQDLANLVVQYLNEFDGKQLPFKHLCQDLRLNKRESTNLFSYLTTYGHDHHLWLSQTNSDEWLVTYYTKGLPPDPTLTNECFSTAGSAKRGKNLETSAQDIVDFIKSLPTNNEPGAQSLFDQLQSGKPISITDILNAYKQIHCPGRPIQNEGRIKKQVQQLHFIIYIDGVLVKLDKVRVGNSVGWKLPESITNSQNTPQVFSNYGEIKSIISKANLFQIGERLAGGSIVSRIQQGLPMTDPRLSFTSEEKDLFKTFTNFLNGQQNRNNLDEVFTQIGFEYDWKNSYTYRGSQL